MGWYKRLVVDNSVTFFLIKQTPTGFIPTEDQGFILYAVSTPPGSSLDRTHACNGED